MPEIKNTFLQGKMNKDLDERLIPNGQYRDALNVEVSTSEGSDVGTVKNILGNERVETLVGTGFKCVGSIADEKNNKLYWFISKYDKDIILEYDANTHTTVPVLVDKYAGTDKAVLKFFGNFITGINIIDDLLFWTDNYGEPKKINVETCKAGTDNINSHTQLSFENGSFHGITVKLTATSSSAPIYSTEGRYVWFDESQIVKLFYPFGPSTGFVNPFVWNASKYADFDPYLIKHYRDGKFLGLKRITVFGGSDGAGNGSHFRVGPNNSDATDKDFKVGDVIFGNNVTIDIAEKHITVIKPKPLNALTVKINHAESAQSTSKTPNLFETKFPRFSYRYKYTDGEYSTFAPFTEPVFNAKYTKDTSKSVDGGVMYNQDTAYDIKEPYNKAMVNAIHSVELSNFITVQTPEDVVEVEVLYKQENSSVIYSIETIKHIDKEWHTSSAYEGLGNSIGIGKAAVNAGDGQYYAIGGQTKGGYLVTTENIYAALPANQLLRPWDNVPRKALAQEVTGNRIVYANYLQNYNIGSKPQVQVSYGNRQNRLGTFDSKGLPSIKSQRNYQLGVVYCDKYGRETPVFTSNDGAVNIPWQDSSGKKNASKSTQLTVGAVNNFPEWVDSLKFFVKETSNEYYNLTMERAWVTKSTYALDNSEGHIWISFPSSDRNKISEEDYIILKKKIGVGEEQVTFENKFRVIDIKNEAPDSIKYDLVNQGVAQNKTVTGGSFFTGATDRLFTRGFNNGDGHRIDCETDSIHILYENWKASSTAVTDTSGFRIPLEDVDSGDGTGQMPIKTKDLYMSWRYNDENGNEQSSSRYKIVGGTKHGSSYILNLERTITTEDAAIARGNVTGNAMRNDLFFQIEKRELKEEENFSGKFFVKISKNQVSSIVETGKEVSNLDKYQVTAKQGVWFWQDDIMTVTGSPIVGHNNYGLTNNFGFDANHSDDPSSTSNLNHIHRNYDQDNNTNNTSADTTYNNQPLRVSDYADVWSGILSQFSQYAPRFFVDSMYMVAGQSEASNYAKYCCVTWSGCTQDDDGDTAENSAWSYPPLKTWLSEFGDTSNLIVPETESFEPTGGLGVVPTTIPAQSTWYNNNLLSTNPLLPENNDYESLRVDGWVGPLQNVSRDMPIMGTGINNVNHINGLEGLVTTNNFHATGPRRWFSGLNGTDYGVGDDTKTYSDNGEEDRHFMHLSFFAPGKDLHNDVWVGLGDPKLYGASAWMAHLQGIWGGGVFTGESPDETFGTNNDFTHLAMEGNYDDAGNYLPEPPGPGVGFGYNLDYRELHERQWDPTFLHKSDGTFVGDPGNKIRDFIRNLYPGSKFRFNKNNSSSSANNVIDDAVYTIKKVTVKKLYNHTSWRKPYNRFIQNQGYDPTTKQHLAYRSVEEVALDYLNKIDSSGNFQGTTEEDDIKDKIEQFGASHNIRLCYIIELDKNPAFSTSTMGNPLDMDTASHDGMSGDLQNSNFTDVEFLDPIQDLLLSDLSKFPAIWEVDPKKQEVDLDIYYEASNNIPVRINERTNELFAPVGCKVEIINATPQQALNDVYLESWDGAKATFFPGFNRGDGSNEINYTNTAFKFIREDGSYTVAEAGGQQLEGETTGFKTEFIFKEDVGEVIGAGLGWYNCFSFGNGLESNRIRDDFNEMFIINGVKASTTTQETYEEERRSHGLIYSGIYNSNSGINDLNQFIMAEKITKDLNPTYGTIQKLFQRRISLIAFCEDRVVQIISNKDAIFNADGNPQLISSSNVLGDANPFVGNFGISKNPESFASESYRAYFTDKARGAVLRLSMDGLTPISKAGMHDWFRDNLSDYTSLIGTYDSYKENYNITLSNTYTENLIFNSAFQQGNEKTTIAGSILDIIDDGVVNAGDSYISSLETAGIMGAINFPDTAPDNTSFEFGNTNNKFISSVTVTNHPAIGIGEFQQTNNAPAEVIAIENIDQAYQAWQAPTYSSSLPDDGWWYDPRFNTYSYDQGLDVWGSNQSNNHDAQVYSSIFRAIGVGNSGGVVHINENDVDESGGWFHSDSPAYSSYKGQIEKTMYYPVSSGSYSNIGKISSAITKNINNGTIVFERANKNSYVEFRNIGATNNNPSAGINGTYATNAGITAPHQQGLYHSSFFNGDELHIQVQIVIAKTVYLGSGFGYSDFYGYNYIQPQIQLYDGNSLIDSSYIWVENTSVGNLPITAQSGTQNYANAQTYPQMMGSDFETFSNADYSTSGLNNTSLQEKNVAGYVTNNVVTFPATNHSTNGSSFATVSNPNDAGVATIQFGFSVKFRDPNQQNTDGTPNYTLNYDSNGNVTNGITAVQVVSDLRIRIKNNLGPASSGFQYPYQSDYTNYPLRRPYWGIKKLFVKKGFGVVAPHEAPQAEIITFDNPDTGTVEQYTTAQLQADSNASFVNGQWILNYGDILAYQGGGGSYIPNIPDYPVPAWVEVQHGDIDEWTFNNNVGAGNGYNNSNTDQWVNARVSSWFGNNHIGTNDQATLADGTTKTWRVPPAVYYSVNGSVATPQTWPFNKTSLGENTFTAQLQGTPGNPVSQPYSDVVNDYWRIDQIGNSGNSAYVIHCQLGSGNEYVVGDWYFIDIEYANNASDNGNKNESTYPAVGSYGFPGATNDQDGVGEIAGVAKLSATNGAVVDNNGVGTFGGGTASRHVRLVPTYRKEYGDNRWVLRAIYQVHPNSEAANHLDYFSLRFYNFKNDTIYVTKIISKKINYVNGTGTAVNWDIDFNGSGNYYDQIHTFSDGVYNSSTDDYSNVYFNAGRLCWENAYGNEDWSQKFQNVIPQTIAGSDPNWTLKFTVGPNPITDDHYGEIGVAVSNSIGNSINSGEFDGMIVKGLENTGVYEITFGMNGAQDGTTDWSIFNLTLDPSSQYTAPNLTLDYYSNLATATSNNFSEMIRFFNSDTSNPLSANVNNITLTNQEELFEGGTVASWNFDGFESTVDDFIVWTGVDAYSGRIQFQNCPIWDPNSSPLVPERITANQLIDKTINRYEKYEITFTYGMTNIIGDPGDGLLHMYYFNSDGYGFVINDIGDPYLTGSSYPQNPNYTRTAVNDDVTGDFLWWEAKATVEVGQSLASNQPLGNTGLDVLRNTFVIRKDASGPNVTAWVDNLSMKRVYDITLPPQTVTYSEDVKGWTSFKSFIPEAGLSLSKKYFTLKDAALYQHYVPTNNASFVTPETAENYNTFYGVHYPSTIKAVLNAEPSVVKTFNTLNYEGSQAHVTNPISALDQFGNSNITINNAEAWSQNYVDSDGVAQYPNIDGWKVTEIKTDMDSGNLQDFIKKEGKWFGYIKGKHVVTDVLDTSRFSVQGIGFASLVSETSFSASNITGGGNGNGGGIGNGGATGGATGGGTGPGAGGAPPGGGGGTGGY